MQVDANTKLACNTSKTVPDISYGILEQGNRDWPDMQDGMSSESVWNYFTYPS